MPIYEYRCKKCGAAHEFRMARWDTPAPECPAQLLEELCRGELERLISTNSFQLKGGGWYKDSYDK